MSQLDKFGKYEVIGQLGEGAMGVVYKAQDPVLKRKVAIKTISATLGGDNELRVRFEREAQAAASLNHPNIITIHDFGEEQGKIYMAMELLEGKDLKERIAEGTLTGLEEKLGIMEQICDGLAFAHASGIVHRDLKPGNIHIQPNGQVKVLDFGLARLGSSDMTKTGIVMGTPNYMSPEQVMGEKVDARSDVFALGAVFYELLTNHKPFEADSVHAVLYQVVHKEPQPVRDWNPDVPALLVELVEKALTKDPEHRFANAGALRSALKHVRQALRTGQEGMSLADMLDLEMVDEADLGPVSGRSPGSAGGIEGTLALDATRPTARAATRPSIGSMPGGVSQPSYLPQPIPQSSKTPYLVAGAVVAVLLLGGGFLYLQSRRSATEQDASSDQVGALTQALVQTQLDLAKRVLADKDYQGAIDQAQRALSLDASNTQAQQIIGEARETLFDLDAAATEARQAFDAGNTAQASDALSKVLAIDPKHPVAAELSAKLNQYFTQQASDARRAMERSREQAQAAGARNQPDFSRAQTLAQDAAAQLRTEEFAVATQNFLQARDAFDRARRAAEAAAAEQERARLAEEKAAAERAAAERAERERLAAQRAAATQPPAPVTTQAPAPTTRPTTPVTTVPPTAPPVPASSFAAGDTAIRGVSGGGPAGFDMSGVTQADFAGAMEFEVEPRELRPGNRYTIKIYLRHTGETNVKLAKLERLTNVNGRRTRDEIPIEENDVKKGRRTLIGRVSGVWDPDIEVWTMDVAATSDKGEKYRSQLALQ